MVLPNIVNTPEGKSVTHQGLSDNTTAWVYYNPENNKKYTIFGAGLLDSDNFSEEDANGIRDIAAEKFGFIVMPDETVKYSKGSILPIDYIIEPEPTIVSLMMGVRYFSATEIK